jgi:hypothetical protein
MKARTHLVVETPRMLLRQWRETDRALVRDMCASEEVMRWFERTQTVAEADEFFERLRTRATNYRTRATKLKLAGGCTPAFGAEAMRPKAQPQCWILGSSRSGNLGCGPSLRCKTNRRGP